MKTLFRSLFAVPLLLATFAMPAQTPSTTRTAPTKVVATKPVADADKLDLNTATADQLKSLKGIGDAYSKRIIDGRPYTAKNQLTSRGILPAATYEGIKDQIIARAPKK